MRQSLCLFLVRFQVEIDLARTVGRNIADQRGLLVVNLWNIAYDFFNHHARRRGRTCRNTPPRLAARRYSHLLLAGQRRTVARQCIFAVLDFSTGGRALSVGRLERYRPTSTGLPSKVTLPLMGCRPLPQPVQTSKERTATPPNAQCRPCRKRSSGADGHSERSEIRGEGIFATLRMTNGLFRQSLGCINSRWAASSPCG